jgi:oxygen-independent coproporphyrinogen III oxidase
MTPILPSLDLIAKYDTQVPRYTSVPSYPFWKNELAWDTWLQNIQVSLSLHKQISLYVHLPFCEKLCYFCACNKIITTQHHVEESYLGTLVKELQLYKNGLDLAGVEIVELHLGGGTPTFFSPDNLASLFEHIFAVFPKHQNFQGSFEGHPANTTKQHFAVMGAYGFRRVSFGIQDFNIDIQTTINRFQTEAQIDSCQQWAIEHGFNSINFDLVYGLPGQTHKHIAYNLDKIIQKKPQRIAYYSYAHVPKLKPSQRLFALESLVPGKIKSEFLQLGLETLQKHGYRYLGFDHFALPNDSLSVAWDHKTLHRNFMGFIPKHAEVLLGLGVSSISDSGTAYFQHPKTWQGYVECIDNGYTNSVGGFASGQANHQLAPQDFWSKKHILNLTCYGATTILRHEPYPIHKHVLEELSQDGLIRIQAIENGLHILVTQLGMFFVRNICAVFDPTFVPNHHSQSL